MNDGELRETLHLHVIRLRRYARALGRDADRADDLVQECLTVALAQAHRWTPGTDLRAWLFTILHNLHIGGLRKRLRQAEHVDLQSVEHLLPTEPTQTSRLEWLEALWAFDQLDPDHRDVLLRSEEHTSELQSLMRISYAVFCLKKKNNIREHI